VNKVLVVDDSETIRQQVSEALVAEGFDVVEASDGVLGLERAAQHELAMIILDVNMPRLNGFEVLERLKEDPKLSPVPVIILTTEAQRTLIDKARKLGASAWLIKPVKMENLVSTVNKVVAKRKTGS
jgi:two-component system chemotaxis response regulator CheY